MNEITRYAVGTVLYSASSNAYHLVAGHYDDGSLLQHLVTTGGIWSLGYGGASRYPVEQVETMEVRNVPITVEERMRLLGDMLNVQRNQNESIRSEAFTAQAQIEEIVKRLHSEADERGWCSEFDDIMDELGLPSRVKDWTVDVTVTYTTSVTVSARNADDALELAGDMSVSDFYLDDPEVEIGDVNED